MDYARQASMNVVSAQEGCQRRGLTRLRLPHLVQRPWVAGERPITTGPHLQNDQQQSIFSTVYATIDGQWSTGARAFQ